jgi:hypothetical protein
MTTAKRKPTGYKAPAPGAKAQEPSPSSIKFADNAPPPPRPPEEIQPDGAMPLDKHGRPDGVKLGLRYGESPPTRPDLVWMGRHYQVKPEKKK